MNTVQLQTLQRCIRIYKQKGIWAKIISLLDMEEVTNKCRLCLKLIKSGGVNVFKKTNEEDHEIGSFIFEAFQLQVSAI